MIKDFHVSVTILWFCKTCWRRGDLLLRTVPENETNYVLLTEQIITTLENTKSKCECNSSSLNLSFIHKQKK
jgi:hypothetical protein